ncbi:MAG: hypothetical protein IJA34_00170 [Lachnospiraceae bacterium]|nr:hypothetical protein [Lachnospiraceae bacterium]
MKILTILCDIDDVLINLLENWLNILNRTHSLNVNVNDVKSWDMTKVYPTLTKEQIFKPIYENEVWQTVKPMPQSQYYLKKLIDDGHQIYLVTATNFETCNVKIEKLISLFPYLHSSQIIIAQNKQMIRGDILIDDGVHNLISGNYIKILYSRPHNLSFDAERQNIIRLSNWEQIYKTISQIAKKE